MRTLVFFDLPSVTSEDKRNYRKFVKTLKKRGFFMLQESVYAKLCLNKTISDLTINQIKKELPKEGCIMSLTITEKQFQNIAFLLGEIDTDVVISDKRVIKL